MLNDVAAIEINVFHQGAALVAIKNNVFLLSRRSATLDHHAQCVWRPHWSMWNIRRDEERFAFAHEMIDDPIPFSDAHFDVALQLVKVLL